MKKSSGAPRAKTATILSSTTVYEGPVFGIRRDEVIEPSGVRTTREVITHPGSVVVLPVLPDGRILLIQQYRHAAVSMGISRRPHGSRRNSQSSRRPRTY